jgi:hypothetical protein
MGGQQKDFISDIVFFQHQDGMRLKVRRHFLQCCYPWRWAYILKMSPVLSVLLPESQPPAILGGGLYSKNVCCPLSASC